MNTYSTPTRAQNFVLHYWPAFVWLVVGIAGLGFYGWAVIDLQAQVNGSVGVNLALSLMVFGVIREFLHGFRTNVEGIGLKKSDDKWIARILQIVILAVFYPVRELTRQIPFLLRVNSMWKRGEVAVAVDNPNKLLRAG